MLKDTRKKQGEFPGGLRNDGACGFWERSLTHR
jgi:hypothetical protein